MSNSKLTVANKKKITSDWNERFPSLGVYKSMHLLNRIGPFLIGILLEVKSGKDSYIPTFHIHNLSKESFSSTSLELKTTLGFQYVNLSLHEKKIEELSKSMHEIAWISFENDLDFENIMLGLQGYANNPPFPHQTEVFDAMVALCLWCNKTNEIDYVLKFAEQQFSKWSIPILQKMGGVQECIKRLEDQVKGQDTFYQFCEKQVIELKANKLPIRKINY